MSTVLCCPACGAEMSLDVLLAHEEVRRTWACVVKQSLPLGAKLERYLRLFKPAAQRLRLDRYAALLTEVSADIQRAAITRRGREWQAPLHVWSTALDAVFDAQDKGTLQLPLKDHGYLYEIVMRLADRAEAAVERADEADRRHGATRMREERFTTSVDRGFTSVAQLLAHRARRQGGEP
jgi:hypothetical protein